LSLAGAGARGGIHVDDFVVLAAAIEAGVGDGVYVLAIPVALDLSGTGRAEIGVDIGAESHQGGGEEGD